ncbi:ribosomal protein L2 [Alternaria alternata]|nr:ribosomal protein L2 [Alternaria alternata]
MASVKDVTDGERSVLSAVDELCHVSSCFIPAALNAPTDLAGLHALDGDEGLGVVLELVGVAEGDSERVG